jgi:hypothetical protein
MEVEIIFATASGGCAAIRGGSPTMFVGIRNGFRNLRTVSVIHIEMS